MFTDSGSEVATVAAKTSVDWYIAGYFLYADTQQTSIKIDDARTPEGTTPSTPSTPEETTPSTPSTPVQDGTSSIPEAEVNGEGSTEQGTISTPESTVQEGGKGGTAVSTDGTPKTGDATNMILFISLGVISLLVSVYFYYLSRKCED